MGSSLYLWFLNAKQRLLDQKYESLLVPALICGFYMQNSDFRARITSLYGSQISPMVFCNQNRDFSTRIPSLYGWQLSSVVLCIHNSVIMTRINSLYGSQTSPVLLCMQNNVISIRITSLYGSQPSSVVFAWKTGTFGAELQVSKGPRLRLLTCECKTACLEPE